MIHWYDSFIWFFLIWAMFIFPILLLNAPPCTLQLTSNHLQLINSLYSFYMYLLSIYYTLVTLLSLGNLEINKINMAHFQRTWRLGLKGFMLLFTASYHSPNVWRLNFQSSSQGSTLLWNSTWLPLPPT